MATTNLSEYDLDRVPSGASAKVGIVVSEWNEKITKGLCNGAISTLLRHDVIEDNIDITFVPGAFELPLASQWLLETNKYDAVIAIGCVIQGETKHFDFVCSGVTQGITELNLKYNTPVIFCVLTDNNEEQSISRSGGLLGNKGDEAAVTALKMIDIKKKIKR